MKKKKILGERNIIMVHYLTLQWNITSMIILFYTLNISCLNKETTILTKGWSTGESVLKNS